jgi:hypothetical protein
MENGVPPVHANALSCVDLERFPLHQPDGEAYATRIAEARDSLATDGCCVLPGFIKREVLAELAAESSDLASHAHFAGSRATVYGKNPDETQPAGHALREEVHRDNGFVAGDNIGATTHIRQLYHATSFRNFVGACVSFDEIHEFADPLAQLVVNVVRPGKGHGWHFDSNEFIVTLVTQPPEAGGRFEYCPQIRTPQQENHESVSEVLAGDSDLVKGLDLRAGDLQIFFGKLSLHRVTPVEGGLDRHTVIFAYARQANLYGNPEKTRQIFGRTTDQHETAGAKSRPDGLTG